MKLVKILIPVGLVVLGVFYFWFGNEKTKVTSNQKDAVGQIENKKKSGSDQNPKLNTEISKSNIKPASKNEESSAGDEAGIHHIIFFDIKDNMSENQLDFLTTNLLKLGEIESVKHFQLGEYEDVGDERALEGRERIIKMRFNSIEDFYAYQNDEKHFEIKKVIGPYLAKNPMTYDYTVQ